MNTAYFYSYAFFGKGGGVFGGGGLTFLLFSLTKLSFIKYFPFSPHLLSLTYIGNPNYKSKVQT